MSEGLVLKLIIGFGGLVVLLSVWVGVRILHSTNRARGFPLLLSRVLMLIALAFLIKSALFSFKKSEKTEQEEDHNLVLLEDRSGSMNLTAGGGRLRSELAGDIAKEMSVTAKKYGLEVTPIYFGRNVVREDELGRLQTDRTLIGKALGEALSRFRATAMLIVSDGAATERLAPDRLVEIAHRSGVSLYTICAASENARLFDVAIHDLACERKNPKEIRVTVRLNAGEGASAHGPFRVRLSIDGEKVQEQQRTAAQEEVFTFRMPRVADGWHEFEVACEAMPGEITTENNVRRGVFEKTSAQRILFVLGSPRLENRHLIRQLKQRFPDLLDTLSSKDASLATVDIEEYLLIVLSDVDSNSLPRSFLEALKGGDHTTLVLAGPHLQSWPDKKLKNFPVAQYRERINLSKMEKPMGRVRLTRTDLPPPLNRFETGSLRQNLFHLVRPDPSAASILNVVVGSSEYPLLIADQLRRPSHIVLLSETTWKWGRNADPVVRRQHDTFWDTVLSWLVDSRMEKFPLKLEFGEEPDLLGSYPVAVSSLAHDPQKVLNPRLEIEMPRRSGPGMTRSVSPMRRRGLNFVHAFKPEQPGEVVWFKALAESGSERLVSQRMPFLAGDIGVELAETAVQPGALKDLVRNADDHFAFFGDHARILNKLFDEVRPKAREKHMRVRNFRLELLLASIIFLLVAFEWFWEMRTRDGVGA